MPRDAAGNYTLPAGNPVISGTVITPTWANPTMDDLGNEMTDSLSRSGKGGMLVPFKNVDGTIGDPGITWINEPTSGFSRTDINVMNASIGGIQSTRWIAGDFGFEIWSGTEWTKPNTAATNPIHIKGVNAALELEETGGGLVSTLIRTATGFIIRPDSTVSTFDLIYEDGLNQWDARATWKFAGIVQYEASPITFNDIPYQGWNTAMNTRVDIAKVSAGNVLVFGETGISTSMRAQGSFGIEIAGGLIGQWQTGGLTLQIDKQYFVRNSANDADFTIATKSFGGSDVLVFGDSTSAGSQYQAPSSLISAHRFFSGGAEQVAIGTDGLRMAEGTQIQGISSAVTHRLIEIAGTQVNVGNFTGSELRFDSANRIEFRVGTIVAGRAVLPASGGLLVADIDLVQAKVGFRNALSVDLAGTSITLIQSYEGKEVRITGNVVTITVNTLEAGTKMRILNVNGPSGCTLVRSSLTRFSLVDGAPSIDRATITIGVGGWADLNWLTTQHCEVTGSSASLTST